MDLSQKKGIVTGSGRGIGKGIAIQFAKSGADVTVADIDIETAENTAEEVRKIGRKAITLKVDVTKIEEVDQMVNKVLDQFGAIDILVNNVGWDDPKPFLQKSPELCDKIIDVNLKSTINCCRAVLPHMIKQKRGKIVNIASDAGRLGMETLVVYSAAKAGIIAFTKALARELAPHKINVNCIAPGMIETPLLLQIMGQGEQMAVHGIGALEKTIPWRRRGRPEDIANAVSFLCSEAADYITGQTLSVNGGLCMMD
jgi:2-hydroxycyclohexanecarboxyl-CoA dehydrogenase